MSDNDLYDSEALRARAALAPLHRPIFDGIERGVAYADDYFSARSFFDALLHAHIVRDHVAEMLRVHEASLGFRLTRGMSAGLLLEYAGFVSKVWKKHAEGLLQAPGESRPRQEFLYQPVQPYLPRVEAWVRNPIRVVHVWEAKGGIVRLWLVCPKNFDENDLWRPGEAHWEIPIEHPIKTLKPDVDFAGDDDEELPINLADVSDGSEPDDEK